MSLAQSEIFERFYQNADAEKAKPMAAYMKNICPFLGIQKPKREALSREFLKQSKKAETIEWAFVDKCWGLEREFLSRSHYILEPVEAGRDYNHLSVRSAVSIILDRLLGESWFETV